MSMQEYKIVSLNVNGLRNPIKQNKLITKMKREQQQIIFWQETHLCDVEHEKLKYRGFKNTFFSSYQQRQMRGVAILISDKITFQLLEQIADSEGSFILVKGHIDHRMVTLLNIYRPQVLIKHFSQKYSI